MIGGKHNHMLDQTQLKALLYIRLSDKETEDIPAAINNNKIQFLEYCRKENYVPIGLVKDIRVEGTKEKRKGLQTVYSLAAGGKFDVWVVKNWSRLARERHVSVIIEKELKKYKKIIRPMQDKEDRLGKLTSDFINEAEVIKRSEDAKKNLEIGYTLGKTFRKPPLGFKYPVITTSDGKHLKTSIFWEHDLKNSNKIKKMFMDYLAGKNISEIAMEFGTSCNTIKKRLINPCYYGYFAVNNKLYKGKFKPIISKECFDGVHLAIDKNRK